MPPKQLRAFWRVVEETPALYLLEEQDEHLVTTLATRFSKVIHDFGDDEESIISIIRSKVPLIRDLAKYRCRGARNPY